MIRKKLKHYIPFIALLLLLLSSSLGLITHIKASGEAKLIEAELEASYGLGDELTIPSGKVSLNNESVPASYRVFFPHGNAVTSPSVKLSEIGKYTIEYKGIISGRQYIFKKNFMVYPQIASLSSKSDSFKYGLNDSVPDADGLNVYLSYGSILSFNHIINLNDYTKADQLIGLYVVPQENKSPDAKQLYVQLTDVYDPENYITVKYNQSIYSDSAVYISAKASNNSTYYGTERGLENGNMISGVHGFAARGSFVGYQTGNSRYKLGLSYDISDNSVHSYNNYYDANPATSGTYITGFANTIFSNPWKGFATGEVYMSVYCDSYVKASAMLFVENVAGIDLSAPYLTQSVMPEINVDYDGHTADNYPDALVGNPYKVFKADALQRFGTEKVNTRVYYAYSSSSQINVDIAGGSFTPSRSGIYTIMYTASDHLGNTAVKMIRVNAVNSSPAIGIELEENDRVTAINTGETVAISKVLSLSGGLGNKQVGVKAVKVSSGKEFEIKDYEFRPVEDGEYKIVYTATDYVKQQNSVFYKLTVENGKKAVFEEEPFLPRYFIKGGEYKLPAVYAYDYYSGTRKQVAASITVTDDSGTKAISSVYTPHIDGESGTVNIKYTAKSSSGQDEYIDFDIPAVDTGLNGTLILSRYFAGNAITATGRSNAIAVSTQTDKAKAEFIRPLLAEGFLLEFNADSTQNAMNRINFYLSDSIDKNVSIKVSFYKGSTSSQEATFVAINDGQAYVIDKIFDGNAIDYDLEYAGGQLIFGKYIVKAPDGFYFPSGHLILQMEFSGVTGAAGILIKKINSQPFSGSITKDNIAPKLSFTNNSASEVSINGIIKIGAVEAFDVLNPKASVRLTVRTPAPDSGYAVATDGTLLKDVIPDREFNIEAERYGIYTVTYIFEDGGGKQATYPLVIRCIDEQPPVIKLSVANMGAVAGIEFTVPEAGIEDNWDTSKAALYVYIYTPDSRYLQINSGKFKPEKAGTYIIKYLAVDGSGNTSSAECIVTVSKGG